MKEDKIKIKLVKNNKFDIKIKKLLKKVDIKIRKLEKQIKEEYSTYNSIIFYGMAIKAKDKRKREDAKKWLDIILKEF